MEEVDVTELIKLRDALRRMPNLRGAKLTLLPFIVKAVVKALKEYPLLNATLDYEKGGLLLKRIIT